MWNHSKKHFSGFDKTNFSIATYPKFVASIPL